MGRSILRLLALAGAIAVLFSSGVCANSLGVPDSEYNALVALYNNTDGPNWTNNANWLTANPNWYGVTVEYAHVTSLVLWSNNLAGDIPASLGNLTKLHELNLGANRVTGPIPAQIGNMTSLWTCDLSRNALTGEIPSSITSLTGLVWADLSYNALSASDPAVLSFLAPMDCCWQNTQTVPPTGVMGWRGGSGEAMVSWTAIAYNFDPGYYEVGYSYTSGGPYTFDPANRTSDKEWESAWMNGLDPSQPVYFVVRTVTLPHYNNQSTLTSLNSEEIASEVLPQAGKLLADGTSVWIDDVIITASFPDSCYIENEDRTWGIRVESPGPDGGYPDAGTRVEAFGVIRTNDDGERYLEVADGNITGSGTIAPLGMTNRALGGGNWNYDPASGTGQMGVTGGTGLNNIGLLVRTTGACTYVDDHTFTIDDGSGVGVMCITPPTILASPAWQYVAVTGASSIKKTDETYSRVLRVTGVNPITSAPPEGITGRWEATSTTGDMVGVVGMLLVQQGGVVTGSAGGWTITNGQISGNVFTGTFVVSGYNQTVAFSLTLDGETLTGTLTETGGEWSNPVTFHRVSPDPVSPYVGRPKVLSATCDGTAIDITWDRPIIGWDYDIVDDSGHSIANNWDIVNSYDPATHVYHIALDPSTPFVPGTHYTIYLENGWEEGDPVDWCDPYGVLAWDWADECYSFDYTYQTPPPPPPTPGFIMGYRTPNKPVQWVTITASWPQAYGLRLYQSADQAVWHDTGLTATRRGPNGDFSLELSSNAYFRVTTVDGNVESIPSAIVHARPLEAEDSGIIIDTPTEGATGVPIAPLTSWHPAWSQTVTLARYGLKVLDTAGNVMWSPLTTATPPQTSLFYGQTSGVMANPATPLATETAYTIRLVAVDSENWQFAMSPGRHFTTTDGSGPPEGITGRWEMTSTTGDMSGVFGMLLVQQGDVVGGSVFGGTIANGQMSGGVFTGTFVVDYEMTIAFSLTLDDETLTGTWTETGGEWSNPVTFHRVSPDPVSPYVGRPTVLSATCNGWSIDVTWDRPINGWDYDIRLDTGESITDWEWSGDGNSYDPDTHVYRMPLHTTQPLVPGTHYTIYLGGDNVTWHDPYGVGAWEYGGDAYSFEYTHQQLPPTPAFIMGYRTGMPAQWVTILASWPQGYGLKLYQSADQAVWHDTGLTPTRRGPNGDFTFELSSNAYFRVTTVDGTVESGPSAIVHARPSEAETSGIVIDTPTEGANGVPLAPLVSWHPVWSQSVTLACYAIKFIDMMGNVTWSPLTTAAPPQTSLIYGQTSGVMGMPATPLATGAAYSINLGACDSENWMFATAPVRHFTTTTTSGGVEEENAIGALYESMKTALEAHDVDATMALFSQDYLHNAFDRAALQSDMADGISHVSAVTYDITNISITGNKASVTASITVTFDDGPPISWTEPDSGDQGLGMGWLIQENGEWLVYGNQVRGMVDVTTYRQPNGSYQFSLMARGSGLISATVQGPNIPLTALYLQPDGDESSVWIFPSQTPQIGDVYTFDLSYGDGRHQTLTHAISSLVPVCPTLTATVQPDNTIAFAWNDVSAQVPGASYYYIHIERQNGNGYESVWSSPDLSLTTFSLTSEVLQPGVTYACSLCLYNVYGDAAQYGVFVTIP